MSSLILQYPEWSDGDYDVLADGVVVGRIMKASAAPEGTPWLWTLIFGYHEDRTPTHGYDAWAGAAGEAAPTGCAVWAPPAASAPNATRRQSPHSLAAPRSPS